MRKQRTRETVGELCRALYEMADRCDFAERDNLIRDWIIMGVRDAALSKAMQMKGGLSLEMAANLRR